MRTFYFSVAFLLFFLLQSRADTWNDSSSDSVKDFTALNTRLTAAYEAEDVATLRTLLAEDHIHNNVFGSVMDKATFLKDIESGILEFVKYDTPELKWMIGKEFAIATGLIEAEAIRGGKPVPATKFRFTRIFVLRDGQWKVLLFQNTMEGTPPPAR
ncbi:nuclear transport factor 2 family protein [Verrucomicrobiales bacterium BCK34]|nr:nuclear transport factor 2 family protein [Verrucomicrobiales bacterium BCK34]